MANPEQTRAEAADQELAKWAALRIYQSRRGAASRHVINDELDKMGVDQQKRARHWLNHYKGIKPEASL